MREILPHDTIFVHFVHETQPIGDRVMERNAFDDEHLPPDNFVLKNGYIRSHGYYWNNRQQMIARRHVAGLNSPPVSSSVR